MFSGWELFFLQYLIILIAVLNLKPPI